jgi:23S rRNA (guanosine2251-2'-O)-methyltransferase
MNHSTNTMAPFVVLLENVRSLHNVGSFFRTLDGIGGAKIILTGYTGCPPRKEIAKVSLGAEDTIPWIYERDPIDAIKNIKKTHTTVAVEQIETSVSLEDISYNKPLCFIFGNEVDGVSSAALEMSDAIVSLPMYGLKESLNVSVCGGAVLYMARYFYDKQQ